MSDKNLTPQQRWQRKNKDVVKKSKANYDQKNPVWAFRPDEELRNWLKKSKESDGESNASVVIRKLKKLMKMEKADATPRYAKRYPLGRKAQGNAHQEEGH